MAQLLALSDYWWGWANMLVRGLHVVAAIGWIGSSFYFIALDKHLAPPADPKDAERGVGGEVWEVHGGGFYRVEKFTVAPHELPNPLYWFKWEAYTTWLSGFGLLIVVYFAHAKTFLVDPSLCNLSTTAAVCLAVGGIILAWVVYDSLCRIFAKNELLLAISVLAFLAAASYTACRIFAGRAAFVEVGTMIGTMMAANVFFVIIPAHWEFVRAKQAGRTPDPRWNKKGKQRSVHNNYLTLPVVFAMLSNHFSFTYTSKHAWIVLVVLMSLGALTRHFFNLHHEGKDVWWIPVVVVVALAAVAIWLRPAPLKVVPVKAATTPATKATPAGTKKAAAAKTPAQIALSVVQARCAPCHSMNPTLVASAPSGIVLDTLSDIERYASAIQSVAVQETEMPPGNSTGISSAERQELANWLASR